MPKKNLPYALDKFVVYQMVIINYCFIVDDITKSNLLILK